MTILPSWLKTFLMPPNPLLPPLSIPDRTEFDPCVLRFGPDEYGLPVVSVIEPCVCHSQDPASELGAK